MNQNSFAYSNMSSSRPGSPTKVSKPSLRSDLITPTMSSDDTSHSLFEIFPPVSSPAKRGVSKPRTPKQFKSPRHEKAGPVRSNKRRPKQRNVMLSREVHESSPKTNTFDFSFMEEDRELQMYHGYEEEHVRAPYTTDNEEYSGLIEERDPSACSREYRETRDDEREVEEFTSSSGKNGANALEPLAGQDLCKLNTPKRSNNVENSDLGQVLGFDCIKQGDMHEIQSHYSLNEMQRLQNPCMADEKSQSSIKKLFCFVKRSAKNKSESIVSFPLASQEGRNPESCIQDLQNPFLSKDLVSKERKVKTPKSRQGKWFKAVVHAVKSVKRSSEKAEGITDDVGTALPFLKDGVSKLSSEPAFSESLDSSSGILKSLSKEKDDESLSSIDLLVDWLQCAEIEGVDPICSKDNPRSMLVITSSGSRDLIEAFTKSEEVEYQDTKLKLLKSPRDHRSDSDTDDFVGKVLRLPGDTLTGRHEPTFREFNEDSTVQRSKQFTRRSSLDVQFGRQGPGTFIPPQDSDTQLLRNKSAVSGRRRSLDTQLGPARKQL